MATIHEQYVQALGAVIAEIRELAARGVDTTMAVTTATLNLRDDLQYDKPWVPWHVERMQTLRGAIHDHYHNPLQPQQESP